jgi:hypothetical protein
MNKTEAKIGELEVDDYDLALLFADLREKRAAWFRMSWRERLYNGKGYFQADLMNRRCRWHYGSFGGTGLCQLGERIMISINGSAGADGWSQHGTVLSAAKSRKYAPKELLEELGYLIEDGCVMVRSGYPEPSYRARAIEEHRSASTDPSPGESLDVFREFLSMTPMDRCILQALSSRMDQDGWVGRRDLIRARADGVEASSSIDRLVAAGKIEERRFGRKTMCRVR